MHPTEKIKLKEKNITKELRSFIRNEDGKELTRNTIHICQFLKALPFRHHIMIRSYDA